VRAKGLHYCVTNLFRIPRSKFYQNQPNFIADMTKKHFGLFFIVAHY